MLARIGLSLVAVVALGACVSTEGSAEEASSGTVSPTVSAEAPGRGGCVAERPPVIQALDSQFDKSCVATSAEGPVKVEFTNNDSFGHSFSVYEQKDGLRIYEGQIFNGPRTVVAEVGELAAGTYHFQCDVHPFIMQGRLRIT